MAATLITMPVDFAWNASARYTAAADCLVKIPNGSSQLDVVKYTITDSDTLPTIPMPAAVFVERGACSEWLPLASGERLWLAGTDGVQVAIEVLA